MPLGSLDRVAVRLLKLAHKSEAIMIIIGLVGGIASGKSAVAAELAEQGAAVLDADKAAHELLDLPTIKQTLTSRWGPEVLLASGKIDRRAVASHVFSGTAEGAENLKFLEQTLHPAIRQRFETNLAQLAEEGKVAAVIDAPLLLEAGWGSLCDAVVFVDSSRDLRLRRAIRRNWTEEQFAHREVAQMPIDEKRRLATHTIANDGSPQDLKKATQEVWEAISSDHSP
ncbi:MAG: dephospho-CoA kinase [Planctomycetes bacterium]|nr:dephospho-CoA kinase [Planctomycetota bacterium]